MAEAPIKKSFSPDWLVSGLLTKLGDMFDRLTGRHWKPSSSLATSELIERLKTLLDREAEMSDDGRGFFVPHNIKLKMQWDKFSTDSEEAISKLEKELLTAAVDHINDKRYYTHKPLSVEAAADYFTTGVKLQVSFERFDDEDGETAVDLMKSDHMIGSLSSAGIAAETPEIQTERYRLDFVENEKPKTINITLHAGQRRSIGRTRENHIVIDDTSVSKHHASIVLNSEGRLMLADTGSTNGTFINGLRMAYGKGESIDGSEKLTFGTVEVSLTHLSNPVAPALTEAAPTVAIGDFEFSSRSNDTSESTSRRNNEGVSDIKVEDAEATQT